MQIPQEDSFNRMDAVLGIFREIKGYGLLETKNLIEGAVAHKVFNPTVEELAKLPNGEGSNKFFHAVGVLRAQVTLQAPKCMKKVRTIEVQTHD